MRLKKGSSIIFGAVFQKILGTNPNQCIIATSKIAVTLDNYSKKWYNMSQGDEKNGQNAAQGEAESSC